MPVHFRAKRELEECKRGAFLVNNYGMMRRFISLIDSTISELEKSFTYSECIVYIDQAWTELDKLKQEAKLRQDQNFIIIIEQRIEPHLKEADIMLR